MDQHSARLQIGVKETLRCVIGCRSVLFQSCRVTRSRAGSDAKRRRSEPSRPDPFNLTFTFPTSDQFDNLTYPHLPAPGRTCTIPRFLELYTEHKVIQKFAICIYDHESTQSSFTIKEPVAPPALSVYFAIPTFSCPIQGKAQE